MSEQNRRRISPGRKVAEFVTLGISLFLILGLASVLIRQGLQPRPKFVAVEARPLMDLVEKSGEQYILPIEVANKGDRTLRQVVTQVDFAASNKTESREVTIDYLGQSSRQTIYIYLDRRPDVKHLKVRPTHYLLD